MIAQAHESSMRDRSRIINNILRFFFFFDHRASAAFCALAFRSAGVSIFARAGPPRSPPNRPSATATDINPRVGDYFAFNAELNGLTDKIEYVHSDVFNGIDAEQFDVIVCNPPFVPVPQEAHYFLHSDGGAFGTSVLERLATNWQSHTAFKFQFNSLVARAARTRHLRHRPPR